MVQFHAVMIDETGCEFGATIRARSKAEARDRAREHYPECRCVQLESPAEARRREWHRYVRLSNEIDNNW